MYEVEALAAVIIMFVCILCIIPLNQNALQWCVLCSNVDLTVFYTNPRITVPCDRGILEYLYPDVPRSESFFLCHQTTLQFVHIPPFQYSASSTQLGLGVNPNPAGPRYFDLGVNPNPAGLRYFGLGVNPESRGFSRTRYFGLGVHPNPADFLNRGILVSECWTRIRRIF